MTDRNRWIRTWLLLAIVGVPVGAQPATQFKANVKMKDGSDGRTSTGTMYFGGAKLRTELTSDGQSAIVLIDPASKTQYMLMPTERTYMQMPVGQGPGSMKVTGPSDPANPCGGGSGNTDCVRGERESVNGYDAVRWDYTSAAGVRTRAWISTKLRFTVKSQDDDGSSMELSNIAEGPQPASLFGIPAGYQKMDVAMAGGMGGGRGRGRANANDPMAAAMANMPPELQAQMAAAMRGEGAPKAPAAPKGSAWEKGNGWIVTMTVTASETTGPAKSVNGTYRSTLSIKWTGSAPLNFVSPSAGAPGAPGPIWSLLAGDPSIGTPAANKVPITLSVTTQGTRDDTWPGDCRASAMDVSDPGSSHGTMSGSAQQSVPVTPRSVVLDAQGNLTLSADLKSYDLVFGVGPTKMKEETKTHTETIGCQNKQTHKSDENSTADVEYSIPVLDVRGQPLPATVSTITGSAKTTIRINGAHELNANVSWTIAPIR